MDCGRSYYFLEKSRSKRIPGVAGYPVCPASTETALINYR